MTDPPHVSELTGTRWDPDQYLEFSDYRRRAALDLMDRIPLDAPRSIVDLGCGTGNMTTILADRFQSATVWGLDNSPEMLDKARAQSGRIIWQYADARTFEPDCPVDLIYSNAVLHWLDDHARVFPHLTGLLADGGCLAVQMPLSFDLPSHRLMREVLCDYDGKGSTLGDETLRRSVARRWVQDPDFYYDLLAPGTRSLDIWETCYWHILEGDDAVLQWVKSTGLRPVLNGLGNGDAGRFLAEYRRRLRAAYPRREDGRVVFPFRRLFIVARV